MGMAAAMFNLCQTYQHNYDQTLIVYIAGIGNRIVFLREVCAGGLMIVDIKRFLEDYTRLFNWPRKEA